MSADPNFCEDCTHLKRWFGDAELGRCRVYPNENYDVGVQRLSGKDEEYMRAGSVRRRKLEDPAHCPSFNPRPTPETFPEKLRELFYLVMNLPGPLRLLTIWVVSFSTLMSVFLMFEIVRNLLS